MNKASQQAYPYIVGFIRQHVASSMSSDDVEWDKAQLNVRLAEWSGMDVDELHHYLSRDYTCQQLQFAVDMMNASDHQSHADYVQLKALSIAEFKAQSSDLRIQFGVVETEFGKVLLGFTEAGICHITFHDDCDDPETFLRKRWPVAGFDVNEAMAQQYATQLFGSTAVKQEIPAWTYGTDFQIKVWRTLMRLPSGGLINYQQLATLSGAPRAARAVGSAMAKNHLSWLIPCHRVLRQSGDFGHYGGGPERKMAMVAYEAAGLTNR